jgi:hypothetical protein
MSMSIRSNVRPAFSDEDIAMRCQPLPEALALGSKQQQQQQQQQQQRPPSFSRGALPADFSRTASRKRGHGGPGAAAIRQEHPAPV